MSAPTDMFNSNHYQGVRRPLARAETLPGWCYGNEAFYRRELERVFRPSWRLVCRADEIPETGDYTTAWTAAGPAVVVRGEDGTPRAFANTCRHRGAQLVEGQGRCKAFVCPYHSWSYRLSGALTGAPGMAGAPGMTGAEGFDKADYGLLPLRLEDWGGFLFVNGDPDAASLAETLGDMPARFAGHDLEDLRCVRRTTFTIEANWKLLVENALEAYHTGTVHAATVGQQKAEAIVTKGDWIGLTVINERSVATLPGVTPALPEIATLSDAARQGTSFTMLCPSTQFVFAPDCVWWLDFTPLGPTRSKLVLGICFPQATTARPDFEQAVLSYYDRWDRATPEDNDICEAQQRGLAFTARPPGRLAPSEFNVHALDNWVLDRVLD